MGSKGRKKGRKPKSNVESRIESRRNECKNAVAVGRGGQAKHQMDGNASGATRSDEERKRNESQVPKLHSTLGQHQ